MPDVKARLKIRQGASGLWGAINPVLLQGEPGLETDTKRVRIGDGVTAFTGLPFLLNSTLITTSALDTTAGRVTKVGDFGLGLASPTSAASANDYPLGSLVSSNQVTETVAAGLNLPALGGAGAAARWWNVITFGASTRATQIATEVFGIATTKGRTFTRIKHDATWTAWKEIAQGLGAVIAMGADQAAARAAIGLGTLATVSPTGTPDGSKFLRDDNTWVNVNRGYTFRAPQAANGLSTVGFTSLPTLSELEIFLDGVSLDGTNDIHVQLGDASGWASSGYDGGSLFVAASGVGSTLTSAFQIRVQSAARVIRGSVRLVRYAADKWLAMGINNSDGSNMSFTGGSLTLANVTRIRINTSAGTFDLGQIAIGYR